MHSRAKHTLNTTFHGADERVPTGLEDAPFDYQDIFFEVLARFALVAHLEFAQKHV